LTVALSDSCESLLRWWSSCISPYARCLAAQESEPQMLSWTQDTLAIPQALPAPPPKKKHSLLPTLIVLFLVSYGLMCLLAVEQDKTIAAQRSLITSLLGDSTELSHLKVKIFQDQHPQPDAGSSSQAQEPSTQAPSAQAPTNRTPMTQTP